MRTLIIFFIASVALTHLYYTVRYSDERRVYPIKKSPGEDSPDWITLNISTYIMVNGTIRSKTLSYITDYGKIFDCQVYSIDNWNCGEAGFSEGIYYDNGLPEDWKVVGRTRYYLTKCEWLEGFDKFILCPLGVLYWR